MFSTMLKLKNKSIKGFTLIEVLIVIAIMGILSSIVLSMMTDARNRAIDTAMKENMRILTINMEQYINETGKLYMCEANTIVSNNLQKIQDAFGANPSDYGCETANNGSILTIWVKAYNNVCYVIDNASGAYLAKVGACL